MPRHFALVPAAGCGARFSADIPKQYLALAGKPLIYHALEALCQCTRITEVWVVLSPDDSWWKTYDWQPLEGKLKLVFCGGTSRAQSVANGLAALASTAAPDDWILVHDAARPCLSQALLESLFTELADDPVGGLLALPVADTIKRADAQQRVAATLPRDGLWQAQTPQMFRAGLLQQALDGVDLNQITDESSAVEALGLQPLLVEGDSRNFKLTRAQDAILAECLLRQSQESA